jgi:hypothetical protein
LRDETLFGNGIRIASDQPPLLSALVRRKTKPGLFMKSVFEASTGLEAHMILNLLEVRRISGRIEGEYLQGGVGELQAMGFVRVLVAEEDYTEARQIISEWEAIQPPEEESKPASGVSIAIRIFVSGIIVGAVIMYWILKVSGA